MDQPANFEEGKKQKQQKFMHENYNFSIARKNFVHVQKTSFSRGSNDERYQENRRRRKTF